MRKSFILFICITGFSYGQVKELALPRPLFSDHYVKFEANNNSIWFGNNGDIGWDLLTSASGWEWPRGSGKHVVFEAGLVWGGLVNGELRVGGSTYRHGLQGGKILPNGTPVDSTFDRARIYSIRRGDEITGLNPDYNNWPYWDGAPVDNDRKPFMCGDAQMWFVSNDLNSYRTTRLYGSRPIGLEIQTTVWAYSLNPLLNDVVFVRHLLINRSQDNLQDAFLGFWCDYDLGAPNDDFMGVDTTLALGYAYNGKNQDPIYGIPPAAGVLFLQTPIIPSASDTVVFNGKRKAGVKYCPLSSHVLYINTSSVYKDPEFGTQKGATELYNNLQGLKWNGSPFIDMSSGTATRFCLAGDPISKIGWIDGSVAAPSERRSLLSAGKFSLAAGDTQEVVYALIVQQGADRFASVTKLKEYARLVKRVSCGGVINSVEERRSPLMFLSQNFPNPFREQTSITFELPHVAHIQLRIFDLLGREVTTVVDDEREAGIHEVKVELKMKKSGLYFYQLEADGNRLVKKMVIME